MNVNSLHKALTTLIEMGHGHKPVAINKDTFRHPLEGDGCLVLPVEHVEIDWILQLDDDGGTAMNKDGSERGKSVVVLSGEKPRTTKRRQLTARGEAKHGGSPMTLREIMDAEDGGRGEPMTIEDKINALPKMSFDTDNYAAMARVELLREVVQRTVFNCVRCGGTGNTKYDVPWMKPTECCYCADARKVLEATK